MALSTQISRVRPSFLKGPYPQNTTLKIYYLKVNIWQTSDTPTSIYMPTKPKHSNQHFTLGINDLDWFWEPHSYFTTQRFKTLTITISNKDTSPSNSENNTQRFTTTKATLGNHRRRVHHDTPTKQPPKCTCTRRTTHTKQHRKFITSKVIHIGHTPGYRHAHTFPKTLALNTYSS